MVFHQKAKLEFARAVRARIDGRPQSLIAGPAVISPNRQPVLLLAVLGNSNEVIALYSLADLDRYGFAPCGVFRYLNHPAILTLWNRLSFAAITSRSPQRVDE